MTSGVETLIPVGSLTSLEGLYSSCGLSLTEFNKSVLSGKPDHVRWDLTQITPGRMNLAALTCFLAVANRVRDFLDTPPSASLSWNPQVLGFWRDIGFLMIVRDWKLCTWPEGMIGGYELGNTNPHTKLMALRRPAIFTIPDEVSTNNISGWKDVQRDEIAAKVWGYLYSIFYDRKDMDRVLANCVAELVLNAWLWGQTHAFVGWQRTSHGRVSVAVSDCGRGMWESIRFDKHNSNKRICCEARDELDALIAACLLQKRENGLRRTISQVVIKHGGWVKVSSGQTQIEWNERTWPINEELSADIDRAEREESSDRMVTLAIAAKELLQRHNKIVNWHYRIRGVRVAFELSSWH